MKHSFDLPGSDGIDDDTRPLLHDMLASVLMGEAGKHGKAYADLVLYILLAYDLRKRCQDAQAMIREQDGAWLAGCGRGLSQLLRHYIEACGLPDPEIDRALALADRLWTALQTPDAVANAVLA
jgi:hypothetical protein